MTGFLDTLIDGQLQASRRLSLIARDLCELAANVPADVQKHLIELAGDVDKHAEILFDTATSIHLFVASIDPSEGGEAP